MSIISDIKNSKKNLANTVNNKFEELLSLLDSTIPKRKLYVNGGSAELQQYCILLKTELKQKHD